MKFSLIRVCAVAIAASFLRPIIAGPVMSKEPEAPPFQTLHRFVYPNDSVRAFRDEMHQLYNAPTPARIAAANARKK